MPKYGVQIFTWGTGDKVSNGLDNFVDQTLLGGNCGHASMRITVPSNENSLRLLDKYCLQSFEEYKADFADPDSITEERYRNAPREEKIKIPFIEKTEQIPQPDGSVKEAKYIEVDFSWWPGDGGFYLSNLEEDMVDEQESVHVDYAQKWKDYLKPLEKKASGKLGYREMTSSAFATTHQRGLTDAQFKMVNDEIRIDYIEKILEPFDGLFDVVRKLKTVNFKSERLEDIFDDLSLDPDILKDDYLKQVNGEPSLKTFRAFLTEKIGEKLTLRDEALKTLDSIDKLKRVDFNSRRLNKVFEELRLDAKELKKDFEARDNKTEDKLSDFKSFVMDRVAQGYKAKGVSIYSLDFDEDLLSRKLRTMKKLDIGDVTLSNVVKNIGLDPGEILQGYKQEAGEKASLNGFRSYLQEKIVERVNALSEERRQLEEKYDVDELPEIEKQLNITFDKIDEFESFDELEEEVPFTKKERKLFSKIGLDRHELVEKYIANAKEQGETFSEESFSTYCSNAIEAHCKDLLSEVSDLDEWKDYSLDELSDYQIFSDEQEAALNHIGIDEDEIVKDYVAVAKEKGGYDPEQFQSFVNERVSSRYTELKERRAFLEEVEKMKDNAPASHSDFDTRYVTRGHPPDHVTELPLQGPNRRGLNFEGLLKGMQELTSANAGEFDLHTKNCSKTTISVLASGGKHDPVLRSALSEEALGAIGTPQQVLGNVQRAQEVVKGGFLARMGARIRAFSPLQNALGKCISTIQDESQSTGKRTAAKIGAGALMTLALPGMIVRSLANPLETMNALTKNMSKIQTGKGMNKGLKGAILAGFGLGAAILAPFAAIQKTGQLIASGFKAVGRGIKKAFTKPEKFLRLPPKSRS